MAEPGLVLVKRAAQRLAALEGTGPDDSQREQLRPVGAQLEAYVLDWPPPKVAVRRRLDQAQLGLDNNNEPCVLVSSGVLRELHLFQGSYVQVTGLSTQASGFAIQPCTSPSVLCVIATCGEAAGVQPIVPAHTRSLCLHSRL